MRVPMSTFCCSGTQLCFGEWCTEEVDKRESNKLFANGDGEMLFYWNKKYVGATVVTRLFDPDGTQDIRVSLIKKGYYQGYPEPHIECITPNDPNQDARYWSLPWSSLQGNMILLTWDVCLQKLGINVSLKKFNNFVLRMFLVARWNDFCITSHVIYVT